MWFSLFRSCKPKPSTQQHQHSSDNFDNLNRYSSRLKPSSISSRRSLSSLKDSLPENPHIYDISEIRAATNNFTLKPLSSSSNSSISWSCVFDKKPSVVTQRKLRSPIDVSDLHRKLGLLCKCHHSNLVKLYGASVSGSYIYLVYEYINGVSLRDCMRNPRNPYFTVLSNWLSRIQIAAGIADGLDYMHNCVADMLSFEHNYVRSSSIIVSEEPSLVVKICHFGAAQLCGEVSEGKKFEGTRGYMSPEFQMTGIPTIKSDVFAFGVVILELLSGMEPIEVEIDKRSGIIQKVSLIEVARDVIEGGSGRLRQWVDRRLRDSYPVEVAEGLTRVALECVQDDPEMRPNMGRVAGTISKLFLESKSWAESIGIPDDFTVSMAPR